MRLVDITGYKYGRLVVVGRCGSDKFGQGAWKCRCDCGTYIVSIRGNLIKGNTKSCGCLKKEIVKTVNKTHGMVYSREYSSWLSMKNRCKRNYLESHLYYERGIKVCNRWINSFDNFYKDMGPRPIGKTIDRIDNNGNYEPGNCRWATPKEQANNRRPRLLT